MWRSRSSTYEVTRYASGLRLRRTSRCIARRFTRRSSGKTARRPRSGPKTWVGRRSPDPGRPLAGRLRIVLRVRRGLSGAKPVAIASIATESDAGSDRILTIMEDGNHVSNQYERTGADRAQPAHALQRATADHPGATLQRAANQ